MTNNARHMWRLLPFSSNPELELWSGRAAITLLSLRSAEESSLEIIGRSADELEVAVNQSGDGVRVDIGADLRSPRGSDREQPHIVVRVPRTIRARVHADAGPIEARDLGPGALRLETGAGRIALFDVFGQLQLSTGAGQIAGRGIGGCLRVDANAGAILLEIATLDPGDHYVHARAGAVRLELARDVDVRVEIASRRGSVQTDVPSRPGALAVLYVTTEVGSIHQWTEERLSLPAERHQVDVVP